MSWKDEIRKKFPEGIIPRGDYGMTEEEEIELNRANAFINKPKEFREAEFARRAALEAREAPTTVVYVVGDGAVDKVFKNKSDAEAYSKEKYSGVDNVTEYKLE